MLRPWHAAKVAAAIIFSTLWASSLLGAQLLGDLNTTKAADAGFVPLGAVDLGAVTLFVFDDGIHGTELWATDGSLAGTRLVLDINPGPSSSSITSLIVAQGTAYFWADDGTNGLQLWKSNGAAAGTSLVANITPTDRVVGGPIGPPLVAIGSIVYFAANDGQSGVELWRSDGTSAGTYRLRDIAPGQASSNPDQLTAVGSTLFFTADDGTTGPELWCTDGTPAGTHLVQDIFPGSTGSNPQQLLAIGNVLFFVAANAFQTPQMWRAAGDGSSAAIVLNVGSGNSPPQGLTKVGNGVMFGALDKLYWAGASGAATPIADVPCPGSVPRGGAVVMATRTIFDMTTLCIIGETQANTDIWTSDGTPGGTGPLNPGQGINFGGGRTIFPATGEAYFMAGQNFPGTVTPGATPGNLWRTDGTLAGTHQVSNFALGLTSEQLIAHGNRVYFAAGASVDPAGEELWSTDGTPGGTALLVDIRPGPANSLPEQLVLARGNILFTANDGVVGIQPWISDGTASGTVRLRDTPIIQSTAGSSPNAFFPLAGGALFVADDGVTGRELWFTDGTSAGTRQVADIAPGSASSNPSFFVSLGAQVLFNADDGTTGRELWRTDGTTQGTRRVADINVGAGHGDPLESSLGAFVLNGVAYFGADDGVHGIQLWRSDGTAAGTFLFMNLVPAGDNANLEMVGTLGGRGLFAARVGTALRLWSTDGTVAGTAPLRTDMEIANALDTKTFQGFIYFAGVDAAGDQELWRTDGTAAGTTRVQDLNAGGSSTPHAFVANSTTLMFSACTGGSACPLFASRDPATAVTQLGSFQVNGPVVTDGTRFFFVDDSSLPNRLVISDGTLAGTAYLQGSLPFSGLIGEYVWFSGRLVMTVDDATLGPSIWETDGTAAGTHLLADIDPGTVNGQGQDPGGYFALNTKLIFAGYHPSFGYEPWVISAAAPNADDDAARAAFNTSTRISVLANDGDLAGKLDASSVEIVTPPARGTAEVDTATGEIVYTPATGISGSDSLQYTVKNQQGNASNVANVFIAVATASGPPPGSAPSSPPTTPSTPASGKGGGGAFDLLTLLALALILLGRRLFSDVGVKLIARNRTFHRGGGMSG
jgi:ELWxxDGT repeat protein